ncbi:MAG: transposase [Bryobacteraceae bacterium]|nr:transposase [Bryobacteraceae bacterium]
MRKPHDFRPEQLYAITQRGNGGQWIHLDDEDFTQAIFFMRKYAALHEVRIHGWCLMHNHGHWILEASKPKSISNLMRDMQSRYSHYLNVKYRETPWALIAPLFSGRNVADFAPYLRTGPVNWISPL